MDPTIKNEVFERLRSEGRPMQLKALDRALDAYNRYDIRDAIDELQDEGSVERIRGKGYQLAGMRRPKRENFRRGVIHVNPRGFGFVRSSGLDDDMFVPANAMKGAMHGDEVSARIVSFDHRGPEGEVVEVLERGRDQVVGTLGGNPTGAWLAPDDTRIRGPIELEASSEAPIGHVAVIQITRYPEYPDELPRGRVVATLGEPGDPVAEVAKILVSNDIVEEHAQDAIEEALAYPEDLPEEERAKRVDLTDVPIVAIDPADARDHDDAIWVERDEQGQYRAWIAIADVSHYVKPSTALDREAFARGCSVYLPDRAIPMLPHRLAADLCSLKVGKDRPSLCVEVLLDATGEVIETKIHEAVVRIRAFMSYPSVARALGFTEEADRDPEADARVEPLRVLWDLSTILRRRRMQRGALDLDVPESKIELDDETHAPIGVTERGQDPGVRKAYRLVEEMMLLANEVVAAFMHEHTIPAIYRIHAPPDPQRIDRFAAVCTLLGVVFEEPLDSTTEISPKQISRVMKKIRHHEKSSILSGLLLRALKRATYDTEDIGHFGLASPAYLHFTSPIRRYPDLTVHRAVRAFLRAGKKALDEEQMQALVQAAVRSSERERIATEAERSVGDLYRAMYMKSHVGEMFEAVVSAMTPSGIYARIATPYVEVFLPWQKVGREAFELDEFELRATAPRSGESIMLGDSLAVTVEEASLTRRMVLARRTAFSMDPPRPIEPDNESRGRGKRRRGNDGANQGQERASGGKRKRRGRAAANRKGKRGRGRR